MSSKVIKWFIRQASFRKTEKPDQHSHSKSGEEKRRFSLPRVSLRKKKSKLVMQESSVDELPVSSTSNSVETSPTKSLSSSDSISEEVTVIDASHCVSSVSSDNSPEKIVHQEQSLVIPDDENKKTIKDCDGEIVDCSVADDPTKSETSEDSIASKSSATKASTDSSLSEENKIEEQADMKNESSENKESDSVHSNDSDAGHSSSLYGDYDLKEAESVVAEIKPKEVAVNNTEKSDNQIKSDSEQDKVDENTELSNDEVEKKELNKNRNENIAVFDEDGDISATTPTSDESEPFNFSKPIKTSPVCGEPRRLLGILKKDERPKSLEKSKVTIVITQPSPDKQQPPPLAPKPLSVNGFSRNKKLKSKQQHSYPDGLNPFGDDSDGTLSDSLETPPCPTTTEIKTHNPFGSEEDDEPECIEITKNKEEQIQKKEPDSTNPFGDSDSEHDRLSPTNPFADHNDNEQMPPTLPPKTDSRRGSLSSGPTPHPRRSKQFHHGSSASLNSVGPVPFPRTVVPSSSSENNSFSRTTERATFHRDSLPNVSDLQRDSIRGSLPPISRIKFPRKKRAAPPPPNSQLPPSGANDGIRSRSSSVSPSSRLVKNPPPRPPPPKKSGGSLIKEKFLRRI